MFVTLAEEAEQMLGAMAIQRNVAQLIDDDQGMALNLFFQLQHMPLLTRFTVQIRQARSGEELDLVTAATRFTSQSDGKMRFPSTGGAMEDHIAAKVDKATLGQIDQTLLVEFGNRREVEVGHFLDHRELGLLKTAGRGAGLALLHFQFRQLLQVQFVAAVLRCIR